MAPIDGIKLIDNNSYSIKPSEAKNPSGKALFDGANYNSSSSSSDTVEELTNNTVSQDELMKELEEFFKSYGVDWNSIKDDALKFIKDRHPLKFFANEFCMSKDDVVKLKQNLTTLINKVKNNGQEVNFENIRREHIQAQLDAALNLVNSDEKVTLDKLKDSNLLMYFAEIAGCDRNELLNKSDEELQKIIEIFKQSYQEIKEESDANNKTLRAVAVQMRAKDNYTLSKLGMSREEFDAKVANGDIKSSRDLLGLSENEPITAEKVQEYFENLNKEFLEEYNALETDEAKAAFKKEAALKQAEMFKLTLIATKGKDKKALMHAISECFNDNRRDLILHLLNSLDEETRTELADSVDNADLKKILTNPDILGEYMGKMAGVDVVRNIAEAKSEDNAIKSTEEIIQEANEFFERDDVKAVWDKLESGVLFEELSDEEKAIAKEIDYLASTQAGHQIALVNGFNISRGVLNSLFDASFGQPIYRDVLSTINKYVEEKNNSLNFTTEQFAQIFDEATNDNYSIVALGNDAPLNPPKSTKGSASSDYGFVTTPGSKPSSDRAAVILQEIIRNSGTDDAPRFTIVKDDNFQSNSNKEGTFDYAGINLREIQSGNINQFMVSTGQSANKIIALGIRQYKNLTTSLQIWLQQRLEAMSDSEFAQAIYGASNNTKVDLIKETGKNPDNIDVVLDYSNRNQLETNSVV